MRSTLDDIHHRYTVGEGVCAGYRIPNLLALPSGTLLASGEGRTRGCKPDVATNRPIVVRASKDAGKTWGNVTVAGPALPNAGTNYPGAFYRDGGATVVLRYELSNGTSSNVDDPSTSFLVNLRALMGSAHPISFISVW